MHTYAFEKLDVWQNARQLTVVIYQITNSYPKEEKFGIVNQMRRAAISIASNIAEGSARKSSKDQAHFYHMAYSSLLELLNQLIISSDLKFISEELLMEARTKIEILSMMLNSLHRAVLSADSTSKP